tara:strand:+ start:1034 stop:1936 length:903 start_codon:yes stop_codon:yes gene_type:complete
MLVVMYHYVRRDSAEYPNFNHLRVDDFERQLDYFEKEYGFVTRAQFLSSFDTGKIPKGVLLTFDDGLSDHYENVYPILKKRGIFGIFYVPTGHYKNKQKKLLSVHRVHYLKGKYNSKNLLPEALSYISSDMLDQSKIHEFDMEIYKDQSQSKSEYQLKRLFNYFLKPEHVEPILDILMKKYFKESELYDKIYLKVHQIKEMHDNGYLIGGHTENHNVLSRLGYLEQEREIMNSFSFLENIVGKLKVKSFCYPYGGKSSFNSDTVDILCRNDIHHSFMVGNEDVKDIKNRHFLKRMDCNRF